MMSYALIAGAFAIAAMPATAADVATKAPAPSYAYPTTKCGMYYGVNTMGSTGNVANASVGTQTTQAGIGLTLGYTCPIGIGYWFVDGSADFANFNGASNGFAVTGPAMFVERFGFGAPVDLVMGLIPGLSSLQNAVPSLIPLPAGINVTTSSPYVFGAFHQDDVGVANGFGSNKEYLLSAGFGIGTKVRLSNGVVFDPFAEYILPSSAVCVGPLGGALCYHQSAQFRVGAILEF
jgi:hypothetical protein